MREKYSSRRASKNIAKTALPNVHGTARRASSLAKPSRVAVQLAQQPLADLPRFLWRELAQPAVQLLPAERRAAAAAAAAPILRRRPTRARTRATAAAPCTRGRLARACIASVLQYHSNATIPLPLYYSITVEVCKQSIHQQSG